MVSLSNYCKQLQSLAGTVLLSLSHHNPVEPLAITRSKGYAEVWNIGKQLQRREHNAMLSLSKHWSCEGCTEVSNHWVSNATTRGHRHVEPVEHSLSEDGADISN